MRIAPAALAIALLLPIIALAQTSAQDSLRATIRAEITADPRASQMNEAQIDAMVSALSNQAAKQGITAEQLNWHPYNADAVTEAPPAPCGPLPALFCTMAAAYGFMSPDIYIPIALFAAAAAFVVVVALMRHHKHPHADFPPATAA